MSEVKRYRADHRHVVETEFDDAQYVGAEDYDATQSELSVLREENRILQKQLGERWADISSLRESLQAASEELEIASTECHNAKRNEHNSEMAYKAAIERQEELRNELDRRKTISDNNFALAIDRYFSLKAAEKKNAERDAHILNVTDFVGRLCSAAGDQPSVATGYLRDILDALNPSEPRSSE